MRRRSSAKRIDSGEQAMRSKRTAAYVACASVLAACAILAYDAVHPFFPKPEAVLSWPSPAPSSKPLLPVPRGTAKWPPDPASAAVPFYQLLLSPNDDYDDDAGPPARDAPTGSTTDKARAVDAPKPANKPPAASKETTGQAAPPPADQAGQNTDRDERVPDASARGRYRYYHRYRHRHHHRN
jgi:hypothetical protein